MPSQRPWLWFVPIQIPFRVYLSGLDIADWKNIFGVAEALLSNKTSQDLHQLLEETPCLCSSLTFIKL
jgi:hypothetical protein